MKNKWMKLGVGAAALFVVAGLSLGAVTTVQASDSWLGSRIAATGIMGGPRGGEFGPRAGAPATIAKALGISESDLATALQSGKTVAQRNNPSH